MATKKKTKVSTPARKVSGGYSGIPASAPKSAPRVSGGYSGIPLTIEKQKPIDTKKGGSKKGRGKQPGVGKITGPTNTFIPGYTPPKIDSGPIEEEVVDDTGEDSGLAYQKMQDEKARKDAFELLKDVFNSYGLSELADQISSYMKEGIGTAEATIRLKQSQPYKDRFYGNELRLAAGRNVLKENEYLDLEDSYSETLKAYGLQDYFGLATNPQQRKSRQKAIASVIGADISALEFKERVSTAVDRVKMADSTIKNAFQQFYGIGEVELAKYFLDPTKNLVSLKEKAAAAEIGGAAIGQGLPTTVTTAEDLAQYGIDREGALIGYGNIAEMLPTATKLSGVYKEEGINYGLKEAEGETFKRLASEERKRKRLVSKEEAAFGGSSGTGLGQGALSTQYLRRGSSGGQF